MIQISNLIKKYGETVIFSNLNYTFENTCIYGLVGRNGAGKTTLLNILSNYDKNYTGVISIDGEKMNKVDYGRCFFNNKIIDFLSKTAYNLSRNILLLSTVTKCVLSMPITK